MGIKTFIIAEVEQGAISKETYELVSFAGTLSERRPVIIVLGRDIEAQAKEVAGKTGCDTIAVSGEHLELYNTQAYSEAIMDVIRPDSPCCVCIGHTSMGYDLAPFIAVKQNAACITAVESVHGGLFSRAICSGRFTEDIIPETESVVVTILPGAFPQCNSEPKGSGSLITVKATLPKRKSRTFAVTESLYRDHALKDAEVIVSAGRGVGKKENISLIKTLASVFPKSAVGASRSVCDLGWLEYNHQIGTTGQSVSPRLYIACGISGAIQHVSGMKDSQNIMAINTDPNAAIFRVAHWCIVEDLTTFIPIFIEELKKSIP
ncbi:MAG TPA: electron transfer flavoprotein subunit alpha/FixB family protein [Desulfomonilia bacterium]|nr:electron transfer flavoprotein subunit alpha/FixB family protein [Desulfomonilia bacterium]